MYPLRHIFLFGLIAAAAWHLFRLFTAVVRAPDGLQSREHLEKLDQMESESMIDIVKEIEEAMMTKDGHKKTIDFDQSKFPAHHAYAALCSIFKNEHGNIREWVLYHHWLGIDKFYIFDHGSEPPLSGEVQDLVTMGLVEVFYFSGNSWLLDAPHYQSTARSFFSPQGWAYDSCFRWFGSRHEFIGMLDADEFIVLLDQGSSRGGILDILQSVESTGGLVMSWKMMGPSGLIRKPKTPTMLSYTQCIPRASMESMEDYQKTPGGYTKSFTSTRQYHDGGCNPHRCAIDHRSEPYVNEEGQVENPPQIHWSRIAVLHYVTRSVEEYHLKLERGSGHSQYANVQMKKQDGHKGQGPGRGRGWSYFLLMNDLATDQCPEGVRAYQECIRDGVCPAG